MVLDLIALRDTSRVWLYQADRELTYEELDLARTMLFDFLESWTSHQRELCTYGNIFHRRFLGLFVDESMSGASGCSIDSSVHFVRQLGDRIGVGFFDRMTYCYLDNDENVHAVHHADLASMYTEGTITDETLFFDNLVKNKQDFLTSWVKPLNKSWHYRFV